MSTTAQPQQTTRTRLSAEFEKSAGHRFFQPLSGSWRSIAIDLLAGLAPEFARGRRSIPRVEVVALIEEVISDHPLVSFRPAELQDGTMVDTPPAEAGARVNDWNSPGYRANYYFGQLVSAGWLIEDEFRHNLRRMTVSLDPNAHALLALLRDMSSSSLSTTARFSDTFRSVINTVLDVQRPIFGEHDDNPYATLKDAIDRCAKGMVVLRRIENIFRRITREQAETLDRRRNLELVVDELHQLTRTQYYQELQNPFLYTHCEQAVSHIDDIAFQPATIQRMVQECIARGESASDAVAEIRVRDLLHELSALLAGLRGEAQQIERWATRFLQASLAKFRHLQTIPSRQIEIARRQIDAVAVSLAGMKWWQELPLEALPPCRLPEFGFVWGRSSLHTPHSPRATFKPVPVKRSRQLLDAAVLEQLLATRRKAITIDRACRFVASTIPEPGKSIASHHLKLDDLGALLDVVACFCYASSPKVNFRIERPRPLRNESRYVPAGKWLLERFTLHRIR